MLFLLEVFLTGKINQIPGNYKYHIILMEFILFQIYQNLSNSGNYYFHFNYSPLNPLLEHY